MGYIENEELGIRQSGNMVNITAVMETMHSVYN